MVGTTRAARVPRGPRASTSTAVLLVLLVLVPALLLAVVPAGAPPWRVPPPVQVLAVLLVAAQLVARTAGRVTGPGAAAPGGTGPWLSRPADLVPLSWGLVAALCLLGPVSLALLARAVPVALLAAARGCPPSAVVARTARAVTAVLVCRATGCLLTGAHVLDDAVVTGAGQWPVVLAAGSAGLAVDQVLLRAGHRRWVLDRRPARAPAAGLLLLVAVLVSAPVLVAGAQAGPSVLMLAGVPLLLLLLTAGLVRHQGRGAELDPLTGLHRRDALLTATSQALRRGRPGLVVVDLDRFSDVNDALGEAVGDDLLREVAARLAAHAPAGALVARTGGDEFTVLLPDGAGAAVLADAVTARAARPVRVGAHRVLLPVSVGVAVAAPGRGSVDRAAASTLLRHAAAALHRAKRVRGTVRTHADGLDAGPGGAQRARADRVRLLGDLATALRRGELSVRYQPQVDPRTGAVRGAEALVRWHHPELGAVPPDRFIPLAEESDLVGCVTAFVLDTALADLAAWRADGHRATVAVNLSARLLLDGALPAAVAQALSLHGVPPDGLVLEITETGLVADPLRAGQVVLALRELGCSVAVDDFGTGNCSLGYLTDLAVDELKVDRSFVSAMTSDRAREVIVRSTVRMGLELGLRVVAEGVEDGATQRALASAGVHLVQGSHVGGPVRAAQLLDHLRRQRVAAGG